MFRVQLFLRTGLWHSARGAGQLHSERVGENAARVHGAVTAQQSYNHQERKTHREKEKESRHFLSCRSVSRGHSRLVSQESGVPCVVHVRVGAGESNLPGYPIGLPSCSHSDLGYDRDKCPVGHWQELHMS